MRASSLFTLFGIVLVLAACGTQNPDNQTAVRAAIPGDFGPTGTVGLSNTLQSNSVSNGASGSTVLQQEGSMSGLH